jgi:hypothetical protein
MSEFTVGRKDIDQLTNEKKKQEGVKHTFP